MKFVLLLAAGATCFSSPRSLVGSRSRVVRHSQPPTPDQMAQAAAAMKNLSPENLEMMLQDMENMGPSEREQMKKMGVNPAMLKMTMNMMKSNPGVLKMAQEQMSKMSPEQMAKATAQAQAQMNGLSPEQMESMAAEAARQAPPPPAPVAQPQQETYFPASAKDPALIDALFKVGECCASPPSGGVDLASLKALPPIAALCGDLPDDLSDAELAECWAGEVMGKTRLDRFDFEKVWLALDDLYDDDIMDEMRRPPKTDDGEEEEAEPVAPPLSTFPASDEETQVLATMLELTSKLKRFGVDNNDRKQWPALVDACERFGAAVAGVRPLPAADSGVAGDWRLVFTTSDGMQKGQGITGVGRAPFTDPHAIFERISADGAVVVAEILEFGGQPVVKNELRGSLEWAEDGRRKLERIQGGDVGGQTDPPQMRLSERSRMLTCVGVSSDAKYRLDVGPEPTGYVFYERVQDLDKWFTERRLPVKGGSTAESMRAAAAT